MFLINTLKKSLFSFLKKEPIYIKIVYLTFLLFGFNKISFFFFKKYLGNKINISSNDLETFFYRSKLSKNDFLNEAFLFKKNNQNNRLKKNLVNSQDIFKIVKEIDELSFQNISKIINIDEIDIREFKKLCLSSYAYDSQVPLQSSVLKKKIDNKFNYYSLDPGQSNLQKFYFKILRNKKLKEIINLYLGFEGNLFAINTMITKANSKSRHSVTSMHRDYDDLHFITMFIYWSDVDKDDGATSIIQGSHRSKLSSEKKIYLEGPAGSVFLGDTLGFHSGNVNLKKDRIVTAMRFGKSLNPASYINKDYLFFREYNQLYNDSI
jgi:hypothetical protein